ncbi:SRPBCC family protein [Aquihabitans sp. G128]|uniref:SRPBCC family protein n=1 Tax=Aquihabitans sp. G128 TaxID=2849779 RepID=UPI001C24F9C6|nr:SRPBCC family protein [Aquihabitans sp. G128]QXC63183.1 SRPBCC family protein [Aquihabitans sp. G128]
MSDPQDVVTVERRIPAEASAIFDLIAHPARHQDIDGSGTVRDAKGKTKGERLALGSTFGMSMKMGLPYSMASTVIEFEEGRRLAWQTRGPGPVGKLVGGRIWRYELEPVDGGTLVKETWDITQESPITKLAIKGLGKKTAENMSATLARIEDLLTA